MTANLICFTGTPQRAKQAVDELKRVGCDHVNLVWNFPNPFDRVLLNAMPHTHLFDGNIGFFNCSVSHYRAIKTAYELGEDSVFICEDDVRFRNDIRDIDAVIRSAPDFDVLLLDAIPPSRNSNMGIEKICGGWSKFSSMRSGACYVLSRRGMERIIWLYESAVNPKIVKRKARICDQWFEKKRLPGLSLVMATPNVAVQQTTPGCHNSGNSWRLNGYELLGVDLSKYSNYMVIQRGDKGMKNGLLDLADYVSDKMHGMFTMAEVGVYRGESTELFLKSGHIRKIFCIDPWKSGYDECDIASSSDMSAVESEFDNVAKRWPTTVVKHKGTLDDFKPDCHVEFVYIDACHQYESVVHDIRMALSLTPMLIGGHDYGCPDHPGVKKAVDEILGQPDATFSDGSWVKSLFEVSGRLVI